VFRYTRPTTLSRGLTKRRRADRPNDGSEQPVGACSRQMIRCFASRYTHRPLFLSFFEIWSNFNKLKNPDQRLWTCRQCWVPNKKLQLHRCSDPSSGPSFS